MDFQQFRQTYGLHVVRFEDVNQKICHRNFNLEMSQNRIELLHNFVYFLLGNIQLFLQLAWIERNFLLLADGDNATINGGSPRTISFSFAIGHFMVKSGDFHLDARRKLECRQFRKLNRFGYLGIGIRATEMDVSLIINVG